jgi:hypothetical protein
MMGDELGMELQIGEQEKSGEWQMQDPDGTSIFQQV